MWPYSRVCSTALGVVFGPVVMRVNETDLAQFHIASAVVEAIIDHFLALTVPTPSSLLSPRGSQIRLSQINQSMRALSYSPPPSRLAGVESSSSTTSPNGSAVVVAAAATAALTVRYCFVPFCVCTFSRLSVLRFALVIIHFLSRMCNDGRRWRLVNG